MRISEQNKKIEMALAIALLTTVLGGCAAASTRPTSEHDLVLNELLQCADDDCHKMLYGKFFTEKEKLRECARTAIKKTNLRSMERITHIMLRRKVANYVFDVGNGCPDILVSVAVDQVGDTINQFLVEPIIF